MYIQIFFVKKISLAINVTLSQKPSCNFARMKKWATLGLIVGMLTCFLAFMPGKPVNTKAALGEKLFSEKLLSKDFSISCASCHIPALGFADTATFSLGIYGKRTQRNTPSVLNIKNRPAFFWDGRAAALEQQALMPIAHPDEMGLPIAEAVARLNNHPQYRKLFIKIFGRPANAKNLAAAFAAYENTLETGNSKLDQSFGNRPTAHLTPQEERGRQLFIGDKAKCFDCHSGEDFTNDDFRNIGLYDGITYTDKGRFNITQDSTDMGRFKVPGLRNVAITAPYMHNGRFKTLEEVVEYYDHALYIVPDAINIDPLLQTPLGLTDQEKADLVAFLKTLTDKRYIKNK